MKLLINYNLERSFYERACDSCHTYGLSTLLFLELIIIKDFHSYKTYDIVRNLIDLNHKTLLKNLFFDNYKIFELLE